MPPPDGHFGNPGGSFYDTITAAVADITERGFDSQSRVDEWMRRIREAAIRNMTPPDVMERALNETMQIIFRRMIERGGIVKLHPGVSRFTIERVKPKLRAELDRRIMASANLIKLNRERAVEQTLQRFSGWATSIPAGGSRTVDRADVKDSVRKSMAQLPFEERRVLIDQGHKLNAALSETLAVDGGAIAGVWRSHWRQAGYHYRPDHKERDGQTYLVRGNWAAQRGLVKRGPAGYADEITRPAEEPFCRCAFRWVYSLSALPAEMLTERGREEVKRVRAA